MEPIPPQSLSPDSIDKKTDTAECLRVRGDELFYASHYEEAVSHYHQSLKWKPNQASALHGYGVCLYYLGKPDEALEKLNRAASLSSNPQILVDRALVLNTLERSDEALEDLSKVLEEHPWDTEIVKHIQEIRFKMHGYLAYF